MSERTLTGDMPKQWKECSCDRTFHDECPEHGIYGQGLGPSGKRERNVTGDMERERILVAFGLPHTGHDGIPGAPEGVRCPRCLAERAVDELIAELERAKRERDLAEQALVFLPDVKASKVGWLCVFDFDGRWRGEIREERWQQLVNEEVTKPGPEGTLKKP